MRSFGNPGGGWGEAALVSHGSHRGPKKPCVKPRDCVERWVLDALDKGFSEPGDSQMRVLGGESSGEKHGDSCAAGAESAVREESPLWGRAIFADA